MARLLLIEDEETLAKNIARFLEHSGWDVEIAGTAEDGLKRVAALAPDVILLDFSLPRMDGLAALSILRERDPRSRIVMLTGQGSVELAVDAMKAGAVDFLAKPVVLAQLKLVLDKLVKEVRLRNEVVYCQGRDAGGCAALIGQSPVLTALKDRLRRVVRVESTDGSPPPSLLITGETGSGKELVARACHDESPRRGGPFIEVNCAAIPANLLESELFGHERGAFTDARERKIGLIEAADGGTLFLDEIGEMDLALQAKLLKVLDDHRIRRLGGLQERRVDVRVIAATNQVLAERVEQGRFRADLLHRLRVIALSVPALRERGADIGLLAAHFLEQFGRRYGKPALALTAAAQAALCAHDWPGNVRELRNTIEQAVLTARDEGIDAEDLLLPKAQEACRPFAPHGAVSECAVIPLASMERELITQGLHKSGWNITRAAGLLGISRDTLRYRMERYQLLRPGVGQANG